MENTQTESLPISTSKSFMAVGPTLHYSHNNVMRCWLLAATVYAVTCAFWAKLSTGVWWSFESLKCITSPSPLCLWDSLASTLNIFEYPWQIVVLGLVMGVLAVAPVLISQLMSFIYSIPFIILLVFVGDLPGFAVCVLISCIAVACRPLRFRSRFIAVALCIAPQFFYWCYFGSLRDVEPLKFGFSFIPWIGAWLTSLIIAAVTLGIGHFTRYKPGLVWTSTAVVILVSIAVFQNRIGFDELDYQLYIANNNPELITEFHDHSIKETLDELVDNPSIRIRRYLEGSFYPKDKTELRTKLKEKVQSQLIVDHWPSWFIVPPQLNYQARKQFLFEQYDLFIKKRPQSRRMPIALYFKALLSEYKPDLGAIVDKEMLSFYRDPTSELSSEFWYALYTDFAQSPESCEARLYIARWWASQSRFDEANLILEEAQKMVNEKLQALEHPKEEKETFFSLFHPSADSVMTPLKLDELLMELNLLQNLIGEENRTNTQASAERLAKFIMLDSHNLSYASSLDKLLERTKENDPLRDNILLAKIQLISDENLRAEKLAQLHKQFPNTDGGMQALYNLALLKINLWHRQEESDAMQKQIILSDARAALTNFKDLYPKSVFTNHAEKILSGLPTAKN